MEKPKILVILGPTSSGKSDLALLLSKKFKGEVISADSRQVYIGMDLGTGKVKRDKSVKIKDKRLENKNSKLKINSLYFHEGIRHYLLDVASPKQNFSAAKYKKLAEKSLKEILKKGKLPIICGGTAFYIDTLLNDQIYPSVPPDLALRKKLGKESTERLFKKLQKLDPGRAKNIDQKNKRRLIRALEIILKTGKKIPKIARTDKYDYLKIGLKPVDEILKKRIRVRIEKRLREGMLNEVKKLHETGLSWNRLKSFGLEYKILSEHLLGEINREEMIQKLEKETWQFVKRQITWWKKDKEIIWIKNQKGAEKIAQRFLFS